VKLTRRDIAVLRDVGLSHALTTSQAIELGHFGSPTRANTRFRELGKAGFVRKLDCQFLRQNLFIATKLAAEVVGDKVGRLIEGRISSPRFLQHALSVTNVRIALNRRSDAPWRFEQQLWRKVKTSKLIEVRPDGLLQVPSVPIFVEVDLGNTSLPRFKEKLASYQALATSGQCHDLYGFRDFRLLTVTTGHLRARHLRCALRSDLGFECLIQTFEEVGAAPVASWS